MRDHDMPGGDPAFEGYRTLAGLQTTSVVTVHQDLPASAAPPDEWIVVVDHHGDPVGALRPGAIAEESAEISLIDAVRSSPPILVADVSTPVDLVAERGIALEFTPDSPIVVTHGGAIGGVLADEMLGQVFAPFGVHAGFGPLPGPICIPKIVRICQFQTSDKSCACAKSFETKPAKMPSCPDPNRLGRHDFDW